MVMYVYLIVHVANVYAYANMQKNLFRLSIKYVGNSIVHYF